MDIDGDAAQALHDGLEGVLDLCEAGVAARDVARCVRELAWSHSGPEGADLWTVADAMEAVGEVTIDHLLALGALLDAAAPGAPAFAS